MQDDTDFFQALDSANTAREVASLRSSSIPNRARSLLDRLFHSLIIARSDKEKYARLTRLHQLQLLLLRANFGSTHQRTRRGSSARRASQSRPHGGSVGFMSELVTFCLQILINSRSPPPNRLLCLQILLCHRNSSEFHSEEVHISEIVSGSVSSPHRLLRGPHPHPDTHHTYELLSKHLSDEPTGALLRDEIIMLSYIGLFHTPGAGGGGSTSSISSTNICSQRRFVTSLVRNFARERENRENPQLIHLFQLLLSVCFSEWKDIERRRIERLRRRSGVYRRGRERGERERGVKSKTIRRRGRLINGGRLKALVTSEREAVEWIDKLLYAVLVRTDIRKSLLRRLSPFGSSQSITLLDGSPCGIGTAVDQDSDSGSGGGSGGGGSDSSGLSSSTGDVVQRRHVMTAPLHVNMTGVQVLVARHGQGGQSSQDIFPPFAPLQHFSVLHETSGQHLSNLQKMHFLSFSLIRSWLRDARRVISASATAQKQPMLFPGIVQYCFSLLEMAKYVYSDEGAARALTFNPALPPRLQTPRFIESVFVEVVALLDRCCQIDTNVLKVTHKRISNLFWIVSDRVTVNVSRMKRKETITFYAGTASDSGSLMIAICDFLLHHVGSLFFHPRSILERMFRDHLVQWAMDPYFAIDVVILLLQHHQTIIEHTSYVFRSFYPQLLKLFALQPHQVYNELNMVLPLMISAKNFLDIFHRLLDLPLLCMLMERNRMYDEFEFVLRDDLGFAASFWEQRHIQIGSEWHENVTPRVKVVMTYVPLLLVRFFDTLLGLPDAMGEVYLRELVPVVLKRVNHHNLFPWDEEFLKQVQQTLLDTVHRVFLRHPFFVVDLNSLLLERLQSHSSDHAVFMQVAHTVGHVLSVCRDRRLTLDMVSEYYTLFERVVYEKKAILKVREKMRLADLSMGSGVTPAAADREEEVLQEVFHVVINALCKIVGRFAGFAPRMRFLLSTLVDRSEGLLDPSVILRAREAIKYMADPSVAKAVFTGSRACSACSLDDATTKDAPAHLDEQSSLPFLLNIVSMDQNHIDDV